MPKSNSVFICQSCGATFPKWQGQCTQCGEWNSLVEEVAPPTLGSGRRSARGVGRASISARTVVNPENVVSFSRVKSTRASKRRFLTGIGELDRVLGGGLVSGMVTLLGGEPGIGKSTLLTQVVIELIVADNWQNDALTAKDHAIVFSNHVKNDYPKKTKGTAKKISALTNQGSGLAEEEIGSGPILYIAGEESPSQISLRINRILEDEQFISTHRFGKDLSEKLGQELVFVTTTDVDEILAIIQAEHPRLLIVDSIQTLFTQDLTGASGSVGQIRESAERIVNLVKALSVPTFLVGHVTKEGTIAGPKILEHMVDTVIELSGERSGQLRILRALKNRFGATDEVGVFQLNSYGLEEVPNPSKIFLESEGQDVVGSAIACIMEGTRPILVEVQALVVESQLAMPRRVGRGIELSRIQVLAAVLQKHGHLPLGSTDIFLSAAGGFRIKEPAVDLGLAMAIVSSLKSKKLPQKTIFIGEIGLLGEIRTVNLLDKRLNEAHRLGYERIISRKTHKNIMEVLKEFGMVGRVG
ncbi:MAG: DNA repair protein RadA [Patescibacteria group bacterium]